MCLDQDLIWPCTVCGVSFEYKLKLERHFDSAKHIALSALQSDTCHHCDEIEIDEKGYSGENREVISLSPTNCAF